MTDPRFRNINSLLVHPSKKGSNYPTRDFFNKYYMILVEIKDLNALIDNKPFFDEPVKHKQELYEKPVEMSRNYDYTTRNLLDFSYHQNYYKFSGIDLLRKANTSIPQQINFFGRLEEDDGSAMFFIAKKQQKIVLNFSLNSLNVIE